MEHMSWEEQLRDLVGLNLEKRRLRGDLLAIYNSLTGRCSQMGGQALHPGNQPRKVVESLSLEMFKALSAMVQLT